MGEVVQEDVSAASGSVYALADGGPVYTETNLDRFIVEPLNASSNLAFLILVIFWFLRIRGQPSQGFLRGCLPILLLGFVGGTVYHAFRAHPVWLALDWLPIFGLCIAVSLRYLRKLGPSWSTVGLSYAGPFLGMGVLNACLTDGQRSIVLPTIGYMTLAAWVAIPVLVYLSRHPDRPRKPVWVAVALFLVALSFRSLDRVAPMPFDQIGTHFLWHLLGAASSHAIIGFVYRDDLMSSKRPERSSPAIESS